MTTLTTAQAALATAMAAVPADMTDPGYAAAVAAVTAAQTAVTAAMTAKTTADSSVTTATARVAMYDALGYTTDFAGFGYFCYPPQLGTSIPPTLGGFCHIRCDGGASATASTVTVDLPVSTGGTFQSVFAGEARCGGLEPARLQVLADDSGRPPPARVHAFVQLPQHEPAEPSHLRLSVEPEAGHVRRSGDRVLVQRRTARTHGHHRSDVRSGRIDRDDDDFDDDYFDVQLERGVRTA